jgi:hypothetical protein
MFVSIGFIEGFLIGLCITNCIQPAVSSTFVYYMEGEEAFRNNHPCEFWELTRIWGHVYPSSSTGLLVARNSFDT